MMLLHPQALKIEQPQKHKNHKIFDCPFVNYVSIVAIFAMS